jgi:putative colanic acid biosynthesis acetyltransferase WcaF
VPIDQSKPVCLIDLSRPDNSEYEKGRPLLVWAFWYYLGAPLLAARWLPSSYIKCMVLKLFGSRIADGVYIKPGVRVKFPWFLTVGKNTWIGEDVWIDNLAQVDIGANVCVSQGAYLCTGNHDWKSHNMKLFRRPIILQDGCWVGAKATVCPGTTIGLCSIVTVGSVISGEVPPFEIWTGNPAGHTRDRVLSGTRSPISK